MSDLFTVIEDAEEFEKITTGRQYPIPQQFGPLRWYDNTKRCATRGCSSPTYVTVVGIPRCTTHALQEMNQMLYEFGVEK